MKWTNCVLPESQESFAQQLKSRGGLIILRATCPAVESQDKNKALPARGDGPWIFSCVFRECPPFPPPPQAPCDMCTAHRARTRARRTPGALAPERHLLPGSLADADGAWELSSLPPTLFGGLGAQWFGGDLAGCPMQTHKNQQFKATNQPKPPGQHHENTCVCVFMGIW